MKFRALINGVRLTINGRVQDYASGATFELNPKDKHDAFKIEQLTGTKPPMIEEVRTPKPMTKAEMKAAKKQEEKAATEADGKTKPGFLGKAASAVKSIMGGGGNPDAKEVKIDVYPDGETQGKFVLVLDSGEESTDENPNPKIFQGLSEAEKDQFVKDSGLLEDGKDNVLTHDAPYDFPDPSAAPE